MPLVFCFESRVCQPILARMKVMICLLLVVGSVSAAIAAPEAVANAPAPRVLSPEDQISYDRMVRQELELNTQVKLLGELADEHMARAEMLANAGTADKSQWEKDLAQEIRTKGAVRLAQLNDVTKQRLAFEAAHGPTPPPALGALQLPKSLNPDEFAYLTRLDERLLRARQDIAALEEASRNLQTELQTNHTEEAVGRISGMLEINARQARQSEKEASDLELKKLEFRAI